MSSVQPAQISAIVTGSKSASRKAIVEIKQHWRDGWMRAVFVEVMETKKNVSPSMSRAVFKFRYGRIKRENTSTFLVDSPKVIVDWFIRVRTLGEAEEKAWVGVVVDEQYVMHGSSDTGTLSGDQNFIAYGLEYLLDREPVTDGWAAEGALQKNIDEVPTFNRKGGYGQKLIGNRSSVKKIVTVGGQNHTQYVWSRDNKDWTHLDIAEYLLEINAPNFDDGSGGIFKFRLAGQSSVLDDMVTVVGNQGISVKAILDKIISTQRGLHYEIITTGSGDISVSVNTNVGVDINTDDLFIPKNSKIKNRFVLDDRIDINEAVLRRVTAAKYENLEIIGRPVIACCTLAYADGTLETGWHASKETAYHLALDSDGKSRGDLMRAIEKFDRVYRLHRVPDDWDWTAGDGEGGDKHAVLVNITDDGRIEMDAASRALPIYSAIPTSNSNYWNTFDRHLLRQLPILKEGADPLANQPEYQLPMVFMRNPREDETGGGYSRSTFDNWYQIDKPSDKGMPSIPYRTTDTEMSIHLENRINHLVALNHFAPRSFPPKSKMDPRLDYKTMVATVAMETDARLSVKARITQNPRFETDRTLTIFVDDAEMWYIVPNTVIGVDGGRLKRFEPDTSAMEPDRLDLQQFITPHLLRDDGGRLRQIAAFAREWYGKPRNALTLQLPSITAHGLVGTYVKYIKSGRQSEVVNTIVSEVRHDYQRQTTTIITGYGEVDLKRIIEIPGMSDPRTVGKKFRELAEQVETINTRLGEFPIRFNDKPPELLTDDKHRNESTPNHSTEVYRMSDGEKGDFDDFMWVRAVPLESRENDGNNTGLRPGDAGWQNELEPDLEVADVPAYRLMWRVDEKPILGPSYGGDVAGPAGLGSGHSVPEGGFILVPGEPTRDTFERDDKAVNPYKEGQIGDLIYMDVSNTITTTADGDAFCKVALRYDAMIFQSKELDGAMFIRRMDVVNEHEPSGTIVKGDFVWDSGLANWDTYHAPYEQAKLRPIVRIPNVELTDDGVDPVAPVPEVPPTDPAAPSGPRDWNWNVELRVWDEPYYAYMNDAAVTQVAYGTRDIGQDYDRLKILYDGSYNMGGGTAAPDSKISRGAADRIDIGTAGARDNLKVWRNLQIVGGMIVNTTRLINTDSPYTVLATDYFIICDTDTGAIEIDLPAIVEGTTMRVANVGSSGNDVTIDPNGTQTIAGQGAGVAFTLHDGEDLIITGNTTEGWR